MSPANRSSMNLDPDDPDERHALYNALFQAMGLPPPPLPVTPENIGRKYFIRGAQALQAYRARVQAIADVVARFAAEDAT